MGQKEGLIIAEESTCEANSNAILGEGWRNARKELPENSNMVLGAWVEICGDVKLWNYAVVKYNRFLQNEWMKDTEVVKVEFWKVIDPPSFISRLYEAIGGSK